MLISKISDQTQVQDQTPDIDLDKPQDESSFISIECLIQNVQTAEEFDPEALKQTCLQRPNCAEDVNHILENNSFEVPSGFEILTPDEKLVVLLNHLRQKMQLSSVFVLQNSISLIDDYTLDLLAQKVVSSLEKRDYSLLDSVITIEDKKILSQALKRALAIIPKANIGQTYISTLIERMQTHIPAFKDYLKVKNGVYTFLPKAVSLVLNAQKLQLLKTPISICNDYEEFSEFIDSVAKSSHVDLKIFIVFCKSLFVSSLHFTVVAVKKTKDFPLKIFNLDSVANIDYLTDLRMIQKIYNAHLYQLKADDNNLQCRQRDRNNCAIMSIKDAQHIAKDPSVLDTIEKKSSQVQDETGIFEYTLEALPHKFLLPCQIDKNLSRYLNGCPPSPLFTSKYEQQLVQIEEHQRNGYLQKKGRDLLGKVIDKVLNPEKSAN